LRSMTGYGEAKERNEKLDVYAGVKIRNHRFLDIEVSLPPGVPVKWEEKIRDRIKKEIKRGSVKVYVKIERREPHPFKVTVNEALISRYYEVLSRLSNKLGLKEKITISHLLSLSEVIKLDSEEGIDENLNDLLDKALIEALRQVISMRKKEGKKHYQDIQKCLRRIENNLLNVKKQVPSIRENYQKRIQEEVKRFLKEEDKEKIANEISLLVNRGDINEEIVRFHSHLDQFKKTTKRNTSIGKKLGFILQELQREANTIGAKINSFSISYPIIQIKEDIEKIREQIQNIE